MSKRSLFVLVPMLAILAASTAFAAGELNQEDSVVNAKRDSAAAQLPATVVVRVNNQDKSVAVLQSTDALPADPSAVADSSGFVPMDPSQKLAAGELNQDSSTDSWYFYFYNYNYGYNYYAPTYYYGGYNYYYQPYYNCNYGAYSYYYYSNPYYYSAYPAYFGGYSYPLYHHHCGHGHC